MIFIKEVYGNTESVKSLILKDLGDLYEKKYPKDQLAPGDILDIIVKYSWVLNREIAVYLDRKGNVAGVAIGDVSKVTLPEFEDRRDIAGLSGVRCIHTHPGGSGRLSQVDVATLLKLRLDAMIAVGFAGSEISNECIINNIYAGVPKRNDEGFFVDAELFGPYRPGEIEDERILDLIYEVDRQQERTLFNNFSEAEKVLLAGFEKSGESGGEDSLMELEELAKTSGARIVGKYLQKRQKPDPAYFIGRGKAEELSLARQALNAELVIFDDELSGAHIRNLEEIIGARVIDRTTLILDIFADRARSVEGKLQVELAQLKYMLPRLTGQGVSLSRLGGGIGTRGPGETKLETDRRHIGRRIKFIEKQLAETGKKRQELRYSRKKHRMPVASLAGYTNAGKSTIMNKLCNTDVLAENKLFATLDPTIRKLTDMKDYGREALLVDTVGFIKKLPHDLVEAFKSTLEETIYADLIVHVADASNPLCEEQIKVVNQILNEIGAGEIPRFLVFNKIDMTNEELRSELAANRDEEVFFTSAVTGEGLDVLSEAIFSRMCPKEIYMNLLIPFSEGSAVSRLHDRAIIESSEYGEDGILISARVPPEMAGYFSKYEIKESGSDGGDL